MLLNNAFVIAERLNTKNETGRKLFDYNVPNIKNVYCTMMWKKIQHVKVDIFFGAFVLINRYHNWHKRVNLGKL